MKARRDETSREVFGDAMLTRPTTNRQHVEVCVFDGIGCGEAPRDEAGPGEPRGKGKQQSGGRSGGSKLSGSRVAIAMRPRNSGLAEGASSSSSLQPNVSRSSSGR